MLNQIGPMEIFAIFFSGITWAIFISMVWLLLRLVMVKGFKSNNPKWRLDGFWKKFGVIWGIFTVLNVAVFFLSPYLT